MLVQSLLAALASTATATKLYVSSYAPDGQKLGSVTTFDFQPGPLKAASTNQECGSAPTWLDTSTGGNRMFCVDEGFQTPNASINTLTIGPDGSLKSIAKIDAIQGPVATQFFNNNTAVALAHYGGSAISTFTLGNNSTLSQLQNFTFSTPPGPRPEQDASHVHEAIIDPTGNILVFPDLGADLVRVYSIDKATSLLTQKDSLVVKPGYGPRHAAFWSPDGNKTTYLFVINELANKVVSYKVEYPPTTGGLSFSPVQEIGLYGNMTDPVGTRAAEIAVSPDNLFITASSRNATIFNVANPDPSNSTAVPSDALTVFKPGPDGKLTFIQNAPSGGSFPRHFAYNGNGSMVAVGNQNSQTVVVWSRDINTGKLGDMVASAIALPGPVTKVQWDETR